MSKFVLVWVGILFLFVGGCGTQDGASTGDGQTTLTVASLQLSSDKDAVTANGTDSATLTVRALSASNVVIEGVVINLSSTAGALSVGSVTTNSTGSATFTFDSGNLTTQQSVTITAASSNVVVTKSITVVTSAIDQPGDNVATLELTSDKTTIIADGSDKATLSVRALDVNNVVVPNANINLSATVGALSQGAITTDSNGMATFMFDAGSVATNQTSTITAAVGSVIVTKNINIATNDVNQPSSRVATLELTSNKTTISSGGVDFATLTVRALDENNIVVEGSNVNIVTTVGALSAGTITTGVSGTANFTFDSGSIATNQTATITVAVGSISATKSVIIATENVNQPASNVVSLVLSTDKNIVSFGGTDKAILTVRALDTNNVALQNVTVNLSSTLGVLSTGSVVTDNTGVATLEFDAGNVASLQTAVITAAVGEIVTTKSIEITKVATTPTTKTITQSGTGVVVAPDFTVNTAGNVVFSLTHNGTSNFIVWLKNSQGENLELLVNVIGPFSGSTDFALTPGVYHLSVEADGSWAIDITGEVTSDSNSNNSKVARLQLTSDKNSVQTGGTDTVSLSVRAFDSDNVVVEGAAINVAATLGAVSAGTIVTSGAGMASFSFDAGSVSDEQTAVVTVAVGEVVVTKAISIIPSDIIQPGNDVKKLELTADKNTIGTGGSDKATLTVRALDANNTVIEGALVSAAATMGALNSGSQTTNALGISTFIFDAGNVSNNQTAVITMAVGNIAATKSIAITTQVDPLVGIPVSIDLNHSLLPGVELSQGGSAQISATVRDVYGDLVPDGVSVNFVTDKGTITTTKATEDGVAIATFQASASAGVATITASTSGASSLIQKSTTVRIANGEGTSIVVASIQPPTIGIRGSGIEDTSIISFTVRDSAGNPAVDGTLVTFELSTAVNGGEVLSAASAETAGGTVTVALQSGSVAGTVAVSATVDKGNGLYLVTEARVSIVSNRPDAGRITMGATILNLAGGVTLGLQSEVSAYIADRSGNVVPDQTPVSFISECGSIGTSGGFEATTNLGVASATFQTSAPAPENLKGIAPLGDPGYCRIVAYTPGKGSFQDLNGNGIFDGTDVCTTNMDEPYIDANDSLDFEIGEYYVDVNGNNAFDKNVVNCADDSMIWTSMNLMISDYAAPLSLAPISFNLGLGQSRSFVLNWEDQFGNALVAGTTINITSDGGKLVGQTSFTMPDTVGPGGFLSFALAADPPATAGPDPEPKFVTVTAELIPAPGENNNGAKISDIASGMINLADDVAAEPSVTLESALNVGEPLAQGETVLITAYVLDSGGNIPPDGTLVTFNFSNGLINPITALTLNGKVETEFTAPNLGGPVSISATALGVSGNTEINILAGEASTIILGSVTPNQIGVRGSGLADTSAIVFNVLDQVGNPALDGTIVFVEQTAFTGGGEKISVDAAPLNTTQTINGQIKVVLQSGVRSGTVEISASLRENDDYNGAVQVLTTARVTVVAGAPDAKHFSLAATSLNLPGYTYFGELSLITAYVADRYSNPVPLNTPVFFESEGGATILGDQIPTPGHPWGDSLTDKYGKAYGTHSTQSPLPNTISNKTGRSGVSTVLAWTVGAESFVDYNGNGVWDEGEPFGDLGEPFIDANDNNIYDAASFVADEERYVDENENGRYDGPNGQWDGLKFIWTDIDILWSGSDAADILYSLTATESTTCEFVRDSATQKIISYRIANNGSCDFTFSMTDSRGNPLLGGTKIELSRNLLLGIVLSDELFTVPDTIDVGPGKTEFSFTLTNQSGSTFDDSTYFTINVFTGSGFELSKIFRQPIILEAISGPAP